MKRNILTQLLMVLSILLTAQPPEFFNYQVIIRNTTGEPLATQDVIILFRILKTSSGGPVVYTEKHAVETNQFGLVNVAIGNGTEKTGDITSIEWGVDSYFLNVQVNKGDAIFYDMGTTQLLSVPYAVYAKSSATSGDAVKLAGDQTINGVKSFNSSTVFKNSVSINSEGNIADSRTLLDLSSNNKGVLLPRLTNEDRKVLLQNIPEGMIIFNTSVNQLQIYIAKNWYPLAMGTPENAPVALDGDGNGYSEVIIGTQIWLSENLKTTRYNDGAEIPFVSNIATWASLATPAYCYYNDDIAPETYKALYGGLYNWYALNPAKNGGKNLCPAGFRIPTSEEWQTLVDYYGVNEAVLKNAPFSFRLGGILYADEPMFGFLNLAGWCWTSSESGEMTSYTWTIQENEGTYIVYSSQLMKYDGANIRCIKN